MVGGILTLDYIQLSNKHYFNELDADAQKEVILIGYAANELFNQTQDEQYLLLGQLSVWNATGVDITFMSFDYEEKLNQINDLANSYNSEYDEILASTKFIDTSGQDLILHSNSPVMNLEVTSAINVPDQNATEDNQAPVINAEDIFVQTEYYMTNGGSLLADDQLEDKFFNVSAVDAEDGDLTSNVVIDKSQIDPTNFGVYNVDITATDSLGHTSTKTIRYTIASKAAVVENDTIIDGEHLLLDKEEVVVLYEDVNLYQE